jgi:hypothetical protein
VILTILSAAFANEEKTAAVAQTAEAGAVLLSVADTPDNWAAMFAATTPTPFMPPPAPLRAIAKTQIYRRATDAELALLEATLPTLPLRERLLWQDAEGGTVLVDEVRPFFVSVVGEARADELLAAPT